MGDDRRDRLENIRLHQVERLRRDAAEDAADRPDTEARVELARGDDGTVRAPTRAEIVVALWRSLLVAPVAGYLSLGFGVVRGSGLGFLRAAIMVGGTVAAAIFLVDLVSKTRERHVEHVRVRVFQRHDREPYVLVFLTLLAFAGALYLARI
ncbi:MAG TPA: hypothetical protein VFF73_29055 [Planctomycetota bacterium]|nr:hypothetical protein [Planctomycetota bacterium]